MYKHILLATDLSATSHIVAKRAKYMAKLFGSKLSVLYVIEYRPIIYGGGEFALPMDAELLNVFEKNARKALAQLGKELDIPESQQYMESESVKHSVVNLAEKIGADLIVVGSHGAHGPALLLGSTANGILHAAKCNVLAVRIPDKF